MLRELAQSTQQMASRLGEAEKKIEESAPRQIRGGQGSPFAEEAVADDAITDQVHFSLTAPGVLAPGRSYALDVWAHHAEKLGEILERARKELGSGTIRSKSKGAIQIARDTLITVNLQIADQFSGPH
ncbi:MAG TPA: hypothetical protein PLG50_08395 [bacterium]|nr:hypothetical protein [bacterium]HQG45665.1 hypothetical protein [bacterium]HQI49917.1 hypothetical protein [bacterium]HQJ64180.1 hypothetical protein [bacterium]